MGACLGSNTAPFGHCVHNTLTIVKMSTYILMSTMMNENNTRPQSQSSKVFLNRYQIHVLYNTDNNQRMMMPKGQCCPSLLPSAALLRPRSTSPKKKKSKISQR
jgi:hypothetical protein